MVQIVDYKTVQKEDGSTFNSLVLQGEVEAVKSQETGRIYLTARTTRVACTFDELTCENLKGTQMPGNVKKIEVEPYEYVHPNTGEILTLSHRYEYISEEESIIKENVIKEEMVI